MSNEQTWTEAWDAATGEGLSYFWDAMHVGGDVRFVGHSWEDGGFHTNDNGDPTRDAKGNTVASYRVEDLDPKSAQHVLQVEEWYGA